MVHLSIRRGGPRFDHRVWQLEIEITIPFKIYFQLETGYLKFNAKVYSVPIQVHF